MPKYVVAYISFHNNEIEQEIFQANSPEEAMVEKLSTKGWEFENDDPLTQEYLKSLCFNCDSMISALEILS